MPTASPAPRAPVDAGRTPALHEHAAANLRYIRETIDSARQFTSVPGKGLMAMGAVGILGSYLASRQATADAWLTVWLLAAIVAGAIGVVSMVTKARGRDEPLSDGVGRRFVSSLLPAGFAACVLTFALGSTDPAILAGLWLLLYGAAIMAGGAFSVASVQVLGGAFLGCGALALALPPSFADPLLGFGFGGLHLGFGAYIARQHGG